MALREIPKFPGEVPLQGGIYRHYEGGVYICTGTQYDPRRRSWTVSYRQIEGQIQDTDFVFTYRFGLAFSCDADKWLEVIEAGVEEDEDDVRRFMLLHSDINEWEEYNCQSWVRGEQWPTPHLGAYGTALLEQSSSWQRDELIRLHRERTWQDQLIRLIVRHGMTAVLRARARFLMTRIENREKENLSVKASGAGF